jgi:hypothetical protein
MGPPPYALEDRSSPKGKLGAGSARRQTRCRRRRGNGGQTGVAVGVAVGTAVVVGVAVTTLPEDDPEQAARPINASMTATRTAFFTGAFVSPLPNGSRRLSQR